MDLRFYLVHIFSPIVSAKRVFWIKMVYQLVMLVWKVTLEEDVKSMNNSYFYDIKIHN